MTKAFEVKIENWCILQSRCGRGHGTAPSIVKAFEIKKFVKFILIIDFQKIFTETKKSPKD